MSENETFYPEQHGRMNRPGGSCFAQETLPEEISADRALLASDASSFVTGSVFVVDGGYTLW